MTDEPGRGRLDRIAISLVLFAVVAVGLGACFGEDSLRSDPSSASSLPSSVFGPADTDLPPYEGPSRINQPTTISGVTISGSIEIHAPVTMDGVTMRCRTTYACIRVLDGGSLTITNFRIDGGGRRSSQNSGGLNGDNITARNGEIFGVENGIVGGSNHLIEDVYIHDLALVGSGHPDGVQYDGGNHNIVLRRVRIAVNDTDTSAVMIDNDYESSSGILIDDCVLSGGGYTLYIDGSFSESSGLSVTVKNTEISGFGYGPVLRRGPTTVEQSANTANGQELIF